MSFVFQSDLCISLLLDIWNFLTGCATMLQQNLPSDTGNHVPGDLYEQLSHNQGRSLSHWGG